MGASRLLVLIACEFSGTVRDAFIRAGHDAFSVDILPSESDFGPHIQGDALAASQVLPWDLMIAHPPCTYLTYAGAKHLYIDGRKENGRNEDRWKKMREAALFFRNLLQAKIPRVAIENPIMLDVAQQIVGRSADQFIQPYQFGHRESKRTGLHLVNLPKLIPTSDLRVETLALPAKERDRVHYAAPGPDRWKERSRTFPGIAEAMAQQWGDLT